MKLHFESTEKFLRIKGSHQLILGEQNMTRNELIKRLQDIEWEDFEVKEAKSEVPKNVWETVGAFANTSGGWVILGVKISGKKYTVLGVDNPEKVEQDFTTILRGQKFNRKLEFKCKKYKIDNKTVLGFYIVSASSKDKPIYFNNQANTFIRTGSGDQRATKEEIDAMYRNSSFDKKDEEKTKLKITHLDTSTVQRYRNHLKNINPEHRYNQLSPTELMEKLKVVVDGKVTVGGLLFFGKEDSIRNYISDFRIDYLEVMGTSYEDAPERYQYRLPEEKNLYSYYFAIYERLIKKIDIPFKLKGAFRDENQPQVIAIREALVNLLMHTDYFSNAKPRIRVFVDRIEFFNPGALPKALKCIIKEDFSMPRNPTIAKIFRIINLSENIGSGFDKMINGWKYFYKIEPEITGDFDYYKIVFRFGDEKRIPVKAKTEKTVEKTVEKAVEKTVEKILTLIKDNPAITQKELMAKTGLTRRGVEWNIKKMKKEGVIKRKGPDKGGHWEIKP